MLEKSPRDPFLHYGIGMELKKRGEFDSALASFRRAIELDPAYAYAHYQIGQVFELVGDSVAARQAYESGIASAEAAGDAHARAEIAAALEMLA